MNNSNIDRIVVTGIGLLTPIGCKNNLILENMLSEETSIIEESFKIGEDFDRSFFIHRMKNFSFSDFGVNDAKMDELKTWNKRISNELLYDLAAVKLAIDDCNINYDLEDNQIALVVTHESPGLGDFYSSLLEESYRFFSANKNASLDGYFNKMYKNFSVTAYDLQTFMFLHHIAKVFNIHGHTLFINNACASGLYALEAASQLIKSKKSKAAIVVGGDNPDFYKYLWFKNNGLYSHDGIIRPFAENASGFVFGEGSTVIILESLDSALERGAKIYGEYLGGSFSQDSWKVSFPAIHKNFYKRIIEEVIADNYLKPSDIDWIVTHGVGVNITDRFEAKVINEVFGNISSQPKISAFKPYFGHNLGGSALLETAVMLLSMNAGVIPATLNCESPSKKNKINLIRKNEKSLVNYGLKIACGFAGFNAAILFKSYTC